MQQINMQVSGEINDPLSTEFNDALVNAIQANDGMFTENLKFTKETEAEDASPLGSMSSLLTSLNLSPLEPLLSDVSLSELSSLARPAMLTKLKALGVTKLGDRQALASGLAKAVRLGRICQNATKPVQIHRCDAAGFAEVQLQPGQHCRVFCISDVHTDHKDNMQWLRAHCPPRKPLTFDVLLCPGDISDDPDILIEALKVFKGRFDEVVFTVGNHDLWVKGPAHARKVNRAAAAAAAAGGGSNGSSSTASPMVSPSASPQIARRAAATGGSPPAPAPSATTPPPPPHDSLKQLEVVCKHCETIGVRTQPFWIRAPKSTKTDDAAAAEASAKAENTAWTSAPPRAPVHQDLLLVPLQSWYHASWDVEPTLTEEEDDEVMMEMMWSDFRNCVWPNNLGAMGGDTSLAEHFAQMNNGALSKLLRVVPSRMGGRLPPSRRLDKTETYALYNEVPHATNLWKSANEYFTARPVDDFLAQQMRTVEKRRSSLVGSNNNGNGANNNNPREDVFVISLSHFVPRQELLPEKRTLFQPGLHRVSGSVPLERQLRQLMPDLHVFGHTHLNMDKTIDGIRYIQWPLGTPREQKGQTRASSFGMLCVYDGADGGEVPQVWTHWGRHYEEFERDLSRQEVLPYLREIRKLTGKPPPRSARAPTAQAPVSLT